MVVRKIYDLYTHGDGAEGPMGVKAIVNHLNARGITRRGQKFYKSNVHDILKRTTYVGTHYFNRIDSKTRQEKPREEWIALDVPPIIEKSLFDKVQKTLKAKSPKNAPPTCGQWPDTPHWPPEMRLLRWEHGPADRERRTISLLHLLHLCPEGENGLPWQNNSHGHHG